MLDLANIVRRAWERGANIGLDGVGYGRIHWDDKTKIATNPLQYYRTLAGFAALSRARTALEIGTHWGGSGIAIVRGMTASHGADARLVTIDITTESDNYLPNMPEAPQVKKIVGDANKSEVIKQALAELTRADFLYVDADHSEMPTLLNFCIYNSLLCPNLALFDDIMLTDGMKAFWNTMQAAYPEHTINCVDVIAETRGPAPQCGFGLFVAPAFAGTLADLSAA